MGSGRHGGEYDRVQQETRASATALNRLQAVRLTVLRRIVDEENERLVREEGGEHEIDPEQSLGEAIERFGEEVGWDGLSEWAREHLEDEES